MNTFLARVSHLSIRTDALSSYGITRSSTAITGQKTVLSIASSLAG